MRYPNVIKKIFLVRNFTKNNNIRIDQNNNNIRNYLNKIWEHNEFDNFSLFENDYQILLRYYKIEETY